MEWSLLLWASGIGYLGWTVYASVRRGRVYREHRRKLNGIITDIEQSIRHTGDKRGC